MTRYDVIRELVGSRVGSMLEVGCGPIVNGYRYADLAQDVTCVEWKPVVVGTIPTNVTLIAGDFLNAELPRSGYDIIILADVFEHIVRESEKAFVSKCVAQLKPGGRLIITVPHRGRFACLDPYEVRPAIHRLLWRMGLYRRTFNGTCDIRKGHKHYLVDELASCFQELELVATKRWGYFYEPVSVWLGAIESKMGLRFPGLRMIERRRLDECRVGYGDASYHLACVFRKVS